jgi:hypothetical protein
MGDRGGGRLDQRVGAVREGEAKASRESKESEEGSRVRGSIERGEHGRSEANREKASPLRGEARASGETRAALASLSETISESRAREKERSGAAS